jgi:hypothetical protein
MINEASGKEVWPQHETPQVIYAIPFFTFLTGAREQVQYTL